MRIKTNARYGLQPKAGRRVAGICLMAVGISALLFPGCKRNTFGVDPNNFVTQITNHYFPLAPGTTYRFLAVRGSDTTVNKVTVTRETKNILDVACVVVADTVWEKGDMTEATYDWYAQDKSGNVWYFGEDTKQYDHGKLVGTEGSWMAGEDNAYPGTIMKAYPVPGDTYQQEYLKGEAEDMASVASLTDSVTVPYGTFTNCLMTPEWSPLEPGIVEHKYYASGVGLILIIESDGLRVELVSRTSNQVSR